MYERTGVFGNSTIYTRGARSVGVFLTSFFLLPPLRGTSAVVCAGPEVGLGERVSLGQAGSRLHRRQRSLRPKSAPAGKKHNTLCYHTPRHTTAVQAQRVCCELV